MHCGARGRGGASRILLIEEELAQGNPHKTISVKVILLGRYESLRSASAGYIPGYVLWYIYPCGKVAFFKSCANIPSHVDDLLARILRV